MAANFLQSLSDELAITPDTMVQSCLSAVDALYAHTSMFGNREAVHLQAKTAPPVRIGRENQFDIGEEYHQSRWILCQARVERQNTAIGLAMTIL